MGRICEVLEDGWEMEIDREESRKTVEEKGGRKKH